MFCFWREIPTHEMAMCMDIQCFNLGMSFMDYLGKCMSCCWTLKWIGVFLIHFKIMASSLSREHQCLFLDTHRGKSGAKINELSVGPQCLALNEERGGRGRRGVGVVKLSPAAAVCGGNCFGCPTVGDAGSCRLLEGDALVCILVWVLNTEMEFKNQCPSDSQNTCHL